MEVHACGPATWEADVGKCLSSGGRGCSKPRLGHCSLAWAKVRLSQKKGHSELLWEWYDKNDVTQGEIHTLHSIKQGKLDAIRITKGNVLYIVRGRVGPKLVLRDQMETVTEIQVKNSVQNRVRTMDEKITHIQSMLAFQVSVKFQLPWRNYFQARCGGSSL